MLLKKKCILVILLITLLLHGVMAGGVSEQSTKYDSSDASDEFKSIVLSIEKNMEVRHFSDGGLDTSIIMIPLNKDIISDAIEYKRVTEKMSLSEADSLLKKNYNYYINGNVAAFALLVNVIPRIGFDGRSRVAFNSLGKNTKLKDEYGNSYRPTRFNRIFEDNLSPGWNIGYVYFDNFRGKNDSLSYSIHFNKLVVDEYYSSSGNSPMTFGQWAFSFDETEVNYLSLLKEGISENTIRQNYGIQNANEKGTSIGEVLNAFSSVLTIIGFFM